MHQEYPKALYQGEQLKQINSAEEESAARCDGWADWQPEGEVKRGPGRPKKTKEDE